MDDHRTEIEAVWARNDIKEAPVRSTAEFPETDALDFHKALSRKAAIRAVKWLDTHIDAIESHVSPPSIYYKQKIEDLFKSGKTLFFSDVAAALDIDLMLAVDLCQELIAEGKISANPNKSG